MKSEVLGPILRTGQEKQAINRQSHTIATREGKVNVKLLSRFVQLSATPQAMATRLLCPGNSPGKNTGVGSYSRLQGTFLTQGLNPGLPHCIAGRFFTI